MGIDFAYAYTSLEGRLNRQPYWIANLLLVAVSLVLQFLLGSLLGPTVSILISFVFLYPAYALLVKRGYDRGRPAIIAQAFLGFVVVVNLVQLFGLGGPALQPNALMMLLSIALLIGAIYVLVDYGCLRGTVGPNAYGPDPLGGQS